jgi:hypothetical protein
MCRTGEYRPYGSHKVGLDSTNATRKIIHEMDYTVSAAQLTSLRERFPTIEFVSTGFACHDHPVAHTSYQLVWQQVLNKLPNGALAADIGGNPSHAERFNRPRSLAAAHIDVFCKIMCPKDAVRAKTRWGPAVSAKGVTRWQEMSLYDMYRNDDNIRRFATYSHFLMNHVIYYYSMGEICKLLNMNSQSVCFATIHKLPGEQGYLNCGEQRYEKDMLTGAVNMWNIETGEGYEHPDPAVWFKTFQYADENGAIAWTVNKGCEDAYILTITSCPPGLVHQKDWLNGRIVMRDDDGQMAEAITTNEETANPPPPAYSYKEVVVDFGPAFKELYPKPRVVKITNVKLYDTLCAWMINRKRNSRTLVDLTAKAHREVGNNHLIGSNQRVEITPAKLTEHIAAAFVANAGFEEDLLRAALPGVMGKAAGGKQRVIKNALYLATACKGIISSKDPAYKVLQYLDEVFEPGLL